MKNYVLDCGNYTDSCFNSWVYMIDMMEGIKIENIDEKGKKLHLTVDSKFKVYTLKRFVEMSDTGEFYEASEIRE